MYSQDYDEKFPQWKWDQHYVDGNPVEGGNKNDGTTIWWNAIYPYVKNFGVYHCPDDNYNFKTALRDPNSNDYWGWFKFPNSGCDPAQGVVCGFLDITISYGSNEPVTYDHPALAALPRPAETLIVADMATGLTGWEDWDQYDPNNANHKNHERLRRVAYANGTAQPWFWGTDATWAGPFDPAWDAYGRHSNGNNIGFADGHVKYRPVSKCTIDLFGH